MPGFNDLLTTHPEAADELADTENSPKATEIFAGSVKKAWWKCKNYPHIYESIVKDKVGKNTGCPYCSGNKVLVGFNDLSTTHPALAAEFSKSENSTIRIENISSGSLRKVWWECNQYKHTYQASVGERKRGAGCPYCSGKKVLRGFNDLYTTHPLIAREYAEELNGEISVYSLSLGMTKKLWWRCPERGHKYQSRVYNRTGGQGCPYCSGNKVLKGFNDLQTTHPDLAKEFLLSENFPITTETVSAGSHTRVRWRCSLLHEWVAAIKDRTSGNGCEQCSEPSTSKIQQAFHKELAVLIPDLICDTRLPIASSKRKSMSVDMVSDALKVVIEYDGRYYHSGQRSKKPIQWHLDHDRAKTQALLDAGYHVIRIRENGLVHIGMNTDRVLELDYKYGDLFSKTINLISKFIHN